MGSVRLTTTGLDDLATTQHRSHGTSRETVYSNSQVGGRFVLQLNG
jgi:hypothetical protein